MMATKELPTLVVATWKVDATTTALVRVMADPDTTMLVVLMVGYMVRESVAILFAQASQASARAWILEVVWHSTVHVAALQVLAAMAVLEGSAAVGVRAVH